MADLHNENFRSRPAEQPGGAQPQAESPSLSPDSTPSAASAASAASEQANAFDDDFAAEFPDAEFVHPADMADHLENLSLEKQVSTLSRMSKEDAAEALAELDLDAQEALWQHAKAAEKA